VAISIFVHGGAKEIPVEEHQAHRKGCIEATEAGWKVLESGGSAVEAVEAAIRALEADPTFNAGFGSELNADGEVQMDAAIMNGESLDAGAVAYVQRVRHPISVARMVMEQQEVFLAGDGARHFAEEQGAELCKNEDLIISKKREKWLGYKEKEQPGPKANDTVGCVAMDSHGNIAAGASTGGLGNHPRGRVGDTPQIGCGIYADNESGGCSNTGDGEQIAKVVLARHALGLLEEGIGPEASARQAVDYLQTKVSGEGGCILIDRDGQIGWAHNSKHMAVAYRTEHESAVAFIRKQDEQVRRAAA
jgi:L-asparaginase / beta-aspartyl-peptidase